MTIVLKKPNSVYLILIIIISFLYVRLNPRYHKHL